VQHVRVREDALEQRTICSEPITSASDSHSPSRTTGTCEIAVALHRVDASPTFW